MMATQALYSLAGSRVWRRLALSHGRASLIAWPLGTPTRMADRRARGQADERLVIPVILDQLLPVRLLRFLQDIVHVHLHGSRCKR